MSESEYQYEFDPWPDAVDGKELLNEIYTLLERVIHLTDEQYLAISYWVLHTYFIRPKGTPQVFRYSPILLLTSPLRACGKTTLMLLLAELCHKSRKVTNITDASLYRLLDSFQPTLFLDEIDTYLAKREEMIGHLNSGFDEREGTVYRQTGADWSKTAEFSSWGAKCLAGIGSQHPNLESRAIKIPLERKPVSKKFERIQMILATDPSCFQDIRRKSIRFAIDSEQSLKSIPPVFVESLSDRNNDCWSSLLHLAKFIEPNSEDLTRAAIKICADVTEERTQDEEFISDLAELVFSCSEECVTSESLVKFANSLEDRPYKHKRGGFTAYDLAVILKRYGIKPKQYKIRGKNIRGYDKSDLLDLINKYSGPSNHPAPPPLY